MIDTYKIAVSKYQLNSKIPHGSDLWPKFNASFCNLEADAGMIVDYIWKGNPITTQHKDHWRTSSNYLAGQHLGLDMDTEDDRSTIPVLIKDKFISKYASFVHTTISHKDEAPRARTIFLLDTPIMQAKNYAMAAAALLWLFGTADRQCKDAARFFYGAPKCEVEFLGQVLPLVVVKDLIQKYTESGLIERRRRSNPDYKPTTDQQDVAEALKLIDPWKIDYDEWVGILMALHHEFGDCGLGMAESWADGGPHEVEKKWKSFKHDGNIQGAVTAGTLFTIAKRFGWGKPI
jgi:hypothetical protein